MIKKKTYQSFVLVLLHEYKSANLLIVLIYAYIFFSFSLPTAFSLDFQFHFISEETLD